MISRSRAALAVMEELMKHPITTTFQIPIVRRDTPESERYFNIVKDPQDLTTITQRLRSGEYHSINDWLVDVETTWKNSELVQDTEVQHAATEECRRIFENILRTSGLYPVQAWCRDVPEIRERIDDKLASVPAKYRKLLTSKNDETREETGIPRSEAIALSEAMNLTLPDEEIEILFIIRENEKRQQYGDTEHWVDLAALKSNTFALVKSYVEDVLAKRGVPYPEIQE
jgi:hypothetical protein